jgi:propanediol utilization protein
VLGASGRHVKDRGRRPGTVFGWSAPFQKERFLVVPGEAAREQLKLDDG